jgi:hypothetical protein
MADHAASNAYRHAQPGLLDVVCQLPPDAVAKLLSHLGADALRSLCRPQQQRLCGGTASRCVWAALQLT